MLDYIECDGYFKCKYRMDIEKKFKVLSEVEHVLQRPGMYIGSIITETATKYILDGNKFIKNDVRYNPGFHKLFDEIISNSIDESKRDDSKLTTIRVDVDMSTGKISVYDDGGIPVVMHTVEHIYVPELAFSKMRAGSNFNDDESRTGVGTNGLGSVATNIFSKEFIVETADGKHKFKQTFEHNMAKKSKPSITTSQHHYTKITYTPDFERFGMTGIDDVTYKCIESRVYEVAGTNPGLKVYLNGNIIKMKSFKDYCEMFL